MTVFHRLSPAQRATYIGQLDAHLVSARIEYDRACDDALTCADYLWPDIVARMNRYILEIRLYRARIAELKQVRPVEVEA